MIKITDRAKEKLKSILIAVGADPEDGLRLLPTSDSEFVLGISTEMSGDQVVEYEGYKVLLVGIEYFQILNGKTVDCQDTKEGAVLFVR
jgi:Fe-S cluster assembly iron-binding protein IscA